ncbi:MAG: Gx transporter family protein [Actinobacteria bacterium]|nr:Gx transporter family protein [Actinomycetota bacterium]
MHNKTHRLIILSLLLGMGILLYIVEGAYFPPLPIPGAKLGLANVLTLIMLVFFDSGDCLRNVVLRSITGSFITGTFMSPPFYFSLGGALVSAVLMIIVYKYFYGKFSLVGISLAGAVTHNLTQLFIAVLFIGHFGVFFQLPFLLVFAIITGLFNGLMANFLVERLDILNLNPNSRLG